MSSIKDPATNKIKSPAKSRSRRKVDKSQIQRNFRDVRFLDSFAYDASNTSGQSYTDKADGVKVNYCYLNLVTISLVCDFLELLTCCLFYDYRDSFPTVYLTTAYGGGVSVSGFTVLLITLGLLKASLLSTCTMLVWATFQD